MDTSQREVNISIPFINKGSEIGPNLDGKQNKPNLLSRLFFWWVVPIIEKAKQNPLEANMVADLSYEEKSENLYQKFQYIFNQNKAHPRALPRSLFLTFQKPIMFALLLMFFATVLSMSVPLIVHEVVSYIQDENKDVQRGVIIVLIVFFTRFFNVLFASHAEGLIRKTGLDSISALSMALFSKCMNISFQSNKEHKMGEVLNLMQVDTQRLELVTMYIAGIIFMPLQIITSIVLLFYYIGLSAFGGIGVIFFITIVNLFLGKKNNTYQRQVMIEKDKRTKATNELFSSIKFIKMNALEEYFIDRVDKFRNQELKVIFKLGIVWSFAIMSLWMSPMLIINATFGLFILLSNTLSTAQTFTILSIFQIIQDPLRALPLFINALVQTNISLRRLQKFLLTDEIMIDCIQSQFNQSDNAVEIQNGTFQWSITNEQVVQSSQSQPKPSQVEPLLGIQNTPDENKLEPTNILKAIDMQIKSGEFISIIGDVGSGKSSLFQAMLGEMIFQTEGTRPCVKIQGTIAYVSQKSWIQNCTLKANILFGLPLDEIKYRDAIKYSCLEQDLNILIQGDQTMIGEKGVNLSGGQKARISLARAIYSNSDIYLLDDPISAVDVHVGKDIIQNCLKGYLKNKTRILITHAVNYCQFTDYVYIIENGAIQEQGTFLNIKNQPRFQQLYEKFYKEKHQQEENEQINIEEILEEHEKHHKQIDLSATIIEPQSASTQVGSDLIDNLMMLEDRCKGTISKDVIAQFFKLIGGFYFTFVFLLMVIAQTGCQIVSNLWIAKWTNDSDDHDGDLDNLYYLKIYSLFSLGFGIFAFGRTFICTCSIVYSSRIIHWRMLNCLAYAPQCSFFERVPLGRIMNRFTKDQSVIDTDLLMQVSFMVINLCYLLGNLVLTVYVSSVYIAIPVSLFFLTLIYIQRQYMRASRDLFRLERISKSPILSYFQEGIAGLTVIRAFQKQRQFLSNHAANLDVNRKILVQQVFTNIWFSLLLSLLSFTVNISAIVMCVRPINFQIILKIFYATSNPAFAGLLMAYATQINENILKTVQNLGLAETNLISFERCYAYTKVEPEQAYTEVVRNRLNKIPCIERSKFIGNWPTRGEIQFNSLSVKYRENLPLALHKLTIRIKPKEKIGVVGRTGAGKSTITMSLLRILEAYDGSIYVDGVDISTLSLWQLREAITMIMQDANIFEGTIKQNIDPSMIHSDEDIMAVIDQCCLRSLLDSREGLSTQIHEQGENLSVGERQLLCIARAILKKSKIILIDEATANIDIETEHKIQETIKNAFDDCTVITIAHRINTILHCDKILVLDKGTVREFGDTQILLKDVNSQFYSIYQETLKQQKHD